MFGTCRSCSVCRLSVGVRGQSNNTRTQGHIITFLVQSAVALVLSSLELVLCQKQQDELAGASNPDRREPQVR